MVSRPRAPKPEADRFWPKTAADREFDPAVYGDWEADVIRLFNEITALRLQRPRLLDRIRRLEAVAEAAAPAGLDASHAFPPCLLCNAAVDDPEAREPCQLADHLRAEGQSKEPGSTDE